MKVINKKTGKDVTSKVIKIIENSLTKNGFKIVSKSPYRNESGKILEYKLWKSFHDGEITI
jgi:hypothetical protein